MQHRISKLSSFPICLITLGTMFNGIMIILPSSQGITLAQSQPNQQVTQLNDSKSERLIKAQEVTQKFFDSLIEGQFEQAQEYLSPSVKKYLSILDIQQQWQRVVSDRGSFVEYRKIRPTGIFDTYTVFVTANFDQSIADFVVTLDSNQQITAVDYRTIRNIQVNAAEFVEALSNGRYGVARTYLTPELKQTVLPENIEEGWLDILAETDSFKGVSNSKVVQSPSGSDAVLIDLEFERANRSMMIIFNTLSEIVGVDDFPQSPN